VPHIHLVTEIPGPRSRALVARREAAMPPGAARLTPLGVARGRGALIDDLDGNTLIDFAGGIGTLVLGHAPPAVVDAVTAQAHDLLHVCHIVATTEPAVALAERLCALAPIDGPVRAVLMNSGAEAVEAAVSICRSATRRQGIVVFDGAYHGRTNLTMAMTSKFALFKKGFGPFAPEVYRFPFPNVYRRPAGMTPDAFVAAYIEGLDHAFTAIVDPGHVAAVVVEVVQGEGGFIPAPPAWLAALRERCDAHGMALVFDEVQTGIGRTGRLWASQHSGVRPDLMTVAKSLGGGLPLSAVVGRAALMDAPHPGGLGGTFSANPVACAAALAVLDRVATPAFEARAEAIGARLRAALEVVAARHPTWIGDVRGLGPMLAVELVRDVAKRTPWPEGPPAIAAAALQRGLVLLRAGLYSNCVRLLPPLDLADDLLDEAIGVIHQSFDAVGGP
jgi:4-aminobutyrate aminotransferase/(S)-3-amino-2-methylpropionate transaminase